jgi:hypothetical protein
LGSKFLINFQKKGVGQTPGLNIWRIEKFIVKEVPKNSYGTFYEGDSYIVLYTYKSPGSQKLMWNIHFWLGKESTQDEMVTQKNNLKNKGNCCLQNRFFNFFIIFKLNLMTFLEANQFSTEKFKLMNRSNFIHCFQME